PCEHVPPGGVGDHAHAAPPQFTVLPHSSVTPPQAVAFAAQYAEPHFGAGTPPVPAPPAPLVPPPPPPPPVPREASGAASTPLASTEALASMSAAPPAPRPPVEAPPAPPVSLPPAPLPPAPGAPPVPASEGAPIRWCCESTSVRSAQDLVVEQSCPAGQSRS